MHGGFVGAERARERRPLTGMTSSGIRDEIRARIEDKTKVKVGPDGQGSYRYMIGGVLSADRYANAQSALYDAHRPQANTPRGLVVNVFAEVTFVQYLEIGPDPGMF